MTEPERDKRVEWPEPQADPELEPAEPWARQDRDEPWPGWKEHAEK